ncbi:MAG: RnfABCDGE type electron transport complex subunit G [Agathobacter sp.]|nr:RnfABCDGE type electron transport complex subunit G [Agathobacter sp.]
MNKRIVHDALILTAFTLVLGFVLGLVYDVTKGPIKEAEDKAKQEAFSQVFEDASKFEALEFDKDAANKLATDNGFSDTFDDIQTAFDANGEVAGYVITVTAKDGSQGSITFSVGIRNDGTVNGYSITKISETPGLGMKATEESFYSQFQNKLVEAFTVVKSAPAADNEIEAITGSTITSKAIANGCNAAILYFNTELKGGAN